MIRTLYSSIPGQATPSAFGHYASAETLEFLIEEFRKDVDLTKGKNEGIEEEILVRFVASAQVGIIEWWFANDKPVTHVKLAEQLGTLLERNL